MDKVEADPVKPRGSLPLGPADIPSLVPHLGCDKLT